MDPDDPIDDDHKQQPQQIPSTFPSPLSLCTKLVSLQAELTCICIFSLASPFRSVISLFSNFFFRRLLLGLLAAAYVCILLMMVMAAAAVLGVGLVRMWVEEPVSVRESLQLDYTAAHPTAVFSFGNMGSCVPVGQTLYVTLLLVMPESDYNIDVGIFQLSAELISDGGELVAKASHPYMLQFRSLPIRLFRTFTMGIPLLLGITSETQSAVFPILKHRETTHPRTDKVRITISPRAGTSSLPQFYEARLVMVSRLPWMKEVVYRWKWTLYVWTTLYIFVILVMVLVVFLKPIVFPVIGVTPAVPKVGNDSLEVASTQESMGRAREEREVSESLRRWYQSRNKRKSALLHGVMGGAVDSSAASSITYSQGKSSRYLEEGSGDSESVCFEGYN